MSTENTAMHATTTMSTLDRFRIALNNAVILPGGPVRVNGTRVTLVSVLMAMFAPVLQYRLTDISILRSER